MTGPPDLEAEVKRLRREVERHKDMARRAGELARIREDELRVQLLTARAALERVRIRLDALQERPVVRALMSVTRVRNAIRARFGTLRTLVRPSRSRPAGKGASSVGRVADTASAVPDPRAHRGRQRELLAHRASAPSDPLRIGLCGHGLDGVADAAGAAGWRVLRTGPDVGAVRPPVDVLVVSDPGVDIHGVAGNALLIALVDGPIERWTRRSWFDDYDVVAATSQVELSAFAASSAQAAIAVPSSEDQRWRDIVAAFEAWVERPSLGIHVDIRSWDVADAWGDLHFARAVQRAIRRLGWSVRVHLLQSRTDITIARDDVRLQILGRHPLPPRSDQVNVTWQISHPDHVQPEIYDGEDLVFVAADPFAAWMSGRVEVPVRPLHQATDPARFTPRGDAPAHELLFVANSRNARRHILEDLLPTTHDLAVYGKGWSARLDPHYLRGDHIPNDRLGAFYAAAAIVLNDHWPDMEREGFLSNRLYDASAAGAFVISDEIDGIEEEFDGGIVTYRDRAHLAELVDHYLAHPDERRTLADRAHQAVVARHTFDHRARELIDAVAPLVRGKAGTLP